MLVQALVLAQAVERLRQLQAEEAEAAAAADKESWPLGAAAAGGHVQHNVLKRLRLILLLHSQNGLVQLPSHLLFVVVVLLHIQSKLLRMSGHQIHHFIVHVCVNIRSVMVAVVSFKMSSIDDVGQVPRACSKLCNVVPLLQSGVPQTG